MSNYHLVEDTQHEVPVVCCPGSPCESTFDDMLHSLCRYTIYVSVTIMCVSWLYYYNSDLIVANAFALGVLFVCLVFTCAWNFIRRKHAIDRGLKRLQLQCSNVIQASNLCDLTVEVVAIPMLYQDSKLFRSGARVNQCEICFDSMVAGDLVVELLCGHCFHRPCMSAWARLDPSCPHCRRRNVPVVPISPNVF